MNTNQPIVGAIIAAAGESRRMGGIENKGKAGQYLA